VIHVYLGYSIVDIKKHLKDIALVIKEMPEKSTAVLYFTYCINKEISWSGSNDINHLVKKFSTVLTDKINQVRGCTLKYSFKSYLIYSCCPLVGSSVEVTNVIRCTCIRQRWYCFVAECS
jgi:hypothetical protein